MKSAPGEIDTVNRTNRVTTLLDDRELARLDELRGALSRPAFLRSLLREPARGEVASHSEALEILSGLARDGGSQAAIALERALRLKDAEPSGDGLSKLLDDPSWMRG